MGVRPPLQPGVTDGHRSALLRSASRPDPWTSAGAKLKGDTTDMAHTVELEIAGRVLKLETGHMAKQADGSVLATYG